MTDLTPKQRAFIRAGCYVYTLADPRDGSIFYVGKGSRLRASQHERDVARGRVQNAGKTERIAEILSAGMSPVVDIVEFGLTPERACAREIEIIAEIGIWALTNMRSGGEIGGNGGLTGQAAASFARGFDGLMRFRPIGECEDISLAKKLRDFLRDDLRMCSSIIGRDRAISIATRILAKDYAHTL